MNILEVKDLKVCFGGVKAVDGISFAIESNEIVGLVGESGSGKTITGYSIMGLLPNEAGIEGGSIKFDGKEILGLSDYELRDLRTKNIGIVFQEPFTSLNPVLRVGYQIEEVLFSHLDITGKEAKTRTLKLIEKVKINNPERVFSDYPHKLSGGERQRIMIAIAIALNPRLLIADEPTTALDVTIQSEILKILTDLKKELGLSILFITHDFGIINEIADRVLVMKNGRIVESGAKYEILKSPKNDYTKRLIEAVPKIGQASLLRQGFGGQAGIGQQASGIFIEAKNLCKSYSVERGLFRKEVARVQAVKNVSMKIEKGKTVGLVGESGCGKSTLGRLLLGLEKPDSGEIIVEDKMIFALPLSVRRMLQIVFQDPYSSLDPRMRAGDVILEGVNFLGIKKEEKEKILKDILNKVQLSYSDRFKYPHQFSGGERQRIAIARALAVKPKFIVLDEPVSSLDVLIQKDILDLLKALRKELDLTYIFISHDLRIIEDISDYVCVMYKGEIVEAGAKNDVFINPQYSYTKTLLNSMPVFL